VRGFVELAQRLAAFVPRSCYAQPSHGSDIPAQLVKRRESVHRPQAVKLQAGLCQAWVKLASVNLYTTTATTPDTIVNGVWSGGVVQNMLANLA